jgi:hypothetical protein
MIGALPSRCNSMDVSAVKDLITLAIHAARQYEQFSDNCSEAGETLGRLSKVVSLCRLIGASGEKRLWEGLEEDIGGLRESVGKAGAIARAALPLDKGAGWLQRGWRGVALFSKAATIADHLRAANAHLDSGVGQLSAKLAAKTAAKMEDVLAALARVERALAQGRDPAGGADVAQLAAAFHFDAQRLGASLQRGFEEARRAISGVDAHVGEVDRHLLAGNAQLNAKLDKQQQQLDMLLQQQAAAPPTPIASAPAPSARIPWADLRFDEKDEDGQILVLGTGSYGTVLAATFSHMRVAVKQLSSGKKPPPAAVAELEREAALQARLSHDHVVRVFGFAVSTADPARPKYGLVMARLHEQLQAVLERAAAGDGPPPPLAWRLSAVYQVASGIAYLHARRVVHADVKPANVMLTAPETGSLLQLTDC